MAKIRDLASWLPGLVGPLVLQVQGVTVEQRFDTWNFTGCVTQTDDEASGATVFAFANDMALATGVLGIANGGTGLSSAGTANQVLISDGSAFYLSTIANANISAGAAIAGSKIADATSSTTGVVKLTGNLGGTASSPTVVGLTIPSEARGDILFRGASAWVRLPIGTAGKALTSNGAGADVSWETAAGAAPSGTGAVSVTSGVFDTPGALSIANGGTALTSAGTANGVLVSSGSAFSVALIVDANINAAAAIAGSKIAGAAASTFGVVKLTGNLGGTASSPSVVGLTIPSEAQGDLLFRGASAWVRLAASTAGKFLTTGGAGADVAWTSTLPIANGGTNLTTAGTASGVITSNGSAFSVAKIVDANVDSAAAITGSKIASCTTGALGVIELAGDLGGTATSPTVLSLTGAAGIVSIATGVGYLVWASTASTIGIKQADNTAISATAQGLTIQAQNATGITSIGGQLTLTSGTGTTSAGSVVLQVGGTTEMVVSATRVTITPVGVAFAIATVAPTFYQLDDSTNSVVGQPLAIHAQNATGTSATGGALSLASGTGTTAAGSVTIATGATTQLTLSTTLNTFANPVAIGSTVATTGSIRFPNAVNMVVCRNGSNGANCVALASDSSNELFVGGDASYATQFAIIRQYASSTQYWGIGSSTYASIQGSRWEFNASIRVGGVSGSNPFSFGSTSKSWPADADYTLTNTEYCNPILFITSGTITAQRNLVLPTVTGAIFFVYNGTSQTLLLKTTGGTGPTVATLTGITVACDGTDYKKIG